MKMVTKGLSAIALVILILSTGCGKSVFFPSKRLDMGPFGENTTAMMNDVQHTLLATRPLYIKPYLRQGEDFIVFQKQWADMQTILHGFALYSTQLVALSRSNLTGTQKAGALADNIDRLMAPLMEHQGSDIHLTRTELDTALASVRSKETLFAALGAAQPVVDAAEKSCNSTFDKLSGQLQRMMAEAQERIDSNSATILESAAYCKALLGRSIKSYSLLFEYRTGNPQALEALWKNDPMLKQFVKTINSAETQNLNVMEKELVARLQNIALMTEQIRSQLEQYRAETRELDEYARANEDTIRKARLAVQTWARSHGNMAAGISVQPAVDMTDILAGAATNAAKKALTVH